MLAAARCAHRALHSPRTPSLTSSAPHEPRLTGRSCSSNARTSRRPAPSRCGAPPPPPPPPPPPALPPDAHYPTSPTFPLPPNAVFGLTDEVARKGVATHSSGNHALFAVLPPPAAGHPLPCRHAQYRARSQEAPPCAAMAAPSRNATPPRPAARPYLPRFTRALAPTSCIPTMTGVIAGQATCSRELMEQVEGLDAVIAAIGGGGWSRAAA